MLLPVYIQFMLQKAKSTPTPHAGEPYTLCLFLSTSWRHLLAPRRMQLKALYLCNFIIAFWPTYFHVSLHNWAEKATVLRGKWGRKRARKMSIKMLIDAYVRKGCRGGGGGGRCTFQRVVYFVCLSAAALAYAARRTVRMINMRMLFPMLFTTRYATPQTRYRQLCECVCECVWVWVCVHILKYAHE